MRKNETSFFLYIILQCSNYVQSAIEPLMQFSFDENEEMRSTFVLYCGT